MILHDIATSERRKTNNAGCTERRYFAKARADCRQASVFLRRPSLKHETLLTEHGKKKANRSKIVPSTTMTQSAKKWGFHDLDIVSNLDKFPSTIPRYWNFLFHTIDHCNGFSSKKRIKRLVEIILEI